MPDDEEVIVEEEIGDEYGEIAVSDYPANANPSALGWYEYALVTMGYNLTGYEYVPTEDTSIVDGKTYYYKLSEGASTMSEAIAYSTYQTYLMYRTTTSASYSKLIDIKDYPDMIGDPNMLDCTTLSDGMEKQIAGIIRLGDGFQFTANYTPTNFSTIKALEGHIYDYALWLGGTSAGVPDGHNGKFAWSGDMHVGFPGKGVDEVQDMSLTAIPSTDVTWSSGT